MSSDAWALSPREAFLAGRGRPTMRPPAPLPLPPSPRCKAPPSAPSPRVAREAIASAAAHSDAWPQSTVSAPARAAPSSPRQVLLPPSHLSPRARRRVLLDINTFHVNRWLEVRGTIPFHRTISKARKAALRSCFAFLDPDSIGSVGVADLALTLCAVGFPPALAADLVASAAVDGEGRVDALEFARICAQAEQRAQQRVASFESLQSARDSFPFALLLQTHRTRDMINRYIAVLHSSPSPPGGGGEAASQQSPVGRRGAGARPKGVRPASARPATAGAATLTTVRRARPPTAPSSTSGGPRAGSSRAGSGAGSRAVSPIGLPGAGSACSRAAAA